MRRVIYSVLRCPRCRDAGLAPDEAGAAEVHFGPLRCTGCEAHFPVSEGVADLLWERPAATAALRSLENPLVARSFERYLRPALHLAVARRREDPPGELLLYRELLGAPRGPLLDLGSGTARFAREWAKDPALAPAVAMEASRAMLDEATAQAREAGVTVDFMRASGPYLPFADSSLGAVLQSESLHLERDVSRLFLEVSRVLQPGGTYVARTYLPNRLSAGLHRRAGLHPRTEAELRSAIAAAGLVDFERVLIPPFILLKAEAPRQ